MRKLKKIKKKTYIRIKHQPNAKSENLSLQNYNHKNEIEDTFNQWLEEIFYNDLKDLNEEEKSKIRYCFYRLKKEKIDPLPLVKNFLDSNISMFDNDIPKKNDVEEKFRQIENIISDLKKYYKKNNSKEKKNIINKENKDTSNKKEYKKYNKRNTNK